MSIWAMKSGDTVATQQPDLATAKTYCATGGHILITPGDEALALGAGWTNIVLAQLTDDWRSIWSNFSMSDGTDPTKVLSWVVSDITTGTVRTVSVPNWSGRLVLPVDDGTANRFLMSNGAGVQPTWSVVPPSTNALLDGANHTDTVAQAVARGALVVGNATPKWDRLAVGSASTLLTSNGTDPSWSAVNLLSAFHADTLAAGPTRGDLVIANSTPKWARFAVGSANTVLFSNGTDPSWATVASLTALLEHNNLLHLKPIVATNCTWNHGSTTITTTGGQFANVRIGDYITTQDLPIPNTQGRKVAALIDSNNVTADATNSHASTDISGATMIFTPGDHYNDTAALDTGTGAGLFLTQGRGDYASTSTGIFGTTFQEIRGPVRWMGYGNGSVPTDFRVLGSTNNGNLDGFSIWRQGTSDGLYFYMGSFSGGRKYIHMRNPSSGDSFMYETTASSGSGVQNKTLTTGNLMYMDETGGITNGSAFRDRSDSSKGLGLDLSGISTATNRVQKAPNYGGTQALWAPVTTLSGATPAATGGNVFKITNGGATNMTNLTGGVDGQHVVLIFTNANTTLKDTSTTGSFELRGSADRVAAANEVVSFVWVNADSKWYEVSASGD